VLGVILFLVLREWEVKSWDQLFMLCQHFLAWHMGVAWWAYLPGAFRAELGRFESRVLEGPLGPQVCVFLGAVGMLWLTLVVAVAL